MAAAVRGETLLKAGGREILLVPSHRALAAIESKLGCGMFKIAERLTSRDFRITDLAAIIQATAQAGGVTMTDEEAWDLVLQNPQDATGAPISAFLSAFEPEGKGAGKDAATENPTV